MSAQREPLSEKIVEDILASILDLTDDSGRLLSPPFRVLQSREVGVFLVFYYVLIAE